jgi:DNA-binding NarL/FixJ family response regulator
VVVLGVNDHDENEIIAYAEAGVVGFIGRDATMNDLYAALQTAIRGGVPCSPQVAKVICQRLSTIARPGATTNQQECLTRRESEIVNLLREGLSNKEIAARLCVATSTVKNHVHSLMMKLGVHRRTLAAAALRARPRVTLSPHRDAQLSTVDLGILAQTS